MPPNASFLALAAIVSAALPAPAMAQSNWNDGSWRNNGRTQMIRCESRNGNYVRCNVDTRGGARLNRFLGRDCRSGHWGIARSYVWVTYGCRAEFEVAESGGDNGGPSAGALIAGAAVAAGLLALLLSKGKKKDGDAAAPETAKPPSSVDIAPNQVPSEAEPSFRRCIDEAARQVGSTGGSNMRLTGSVQHRQQGGDWQFRLPLEATWSGKPQATPAECTANANAVSKLDFLPEPTSP